jgi:hypothetical protein
MRLLILAMIAIFSFVYTAAPYLGWPIYGARYYYPLFPLEVVLVVGFLAKLVAILKARFDDRWMFQWAIIAAFVVMIGWQSFGVAQKIAEYSRRTAMIEKIWQDLAQACEGYPAAVVASRSVAPRDFVWSASISRLYYPDGSIPYLESMKNNKTKIYVYPRKEKWRALKERFGRNICIYKMKSLDRTKIAGDVSEYFYVPFGGDKNDPLKF